MSTTIAVVAAGGMGAAVGARLSERGARVLDVDGRTQRGERRTRAGRAHAAGIG